MPTQRPTHSPCSPAGPAPGSVRRGHRPARRRLATLVLALAAALWQPASAQAVTIGFDDLGLVHGQVVTGVPGVTIVPHDFTRSHHFAVVFDTEESGTADPDLEAAFSGLPRWSGGNLAGERLDLVLILQENDTLCYTGVCANPDDEGRRPAGTLSFLFDTPITSFGFDLIDVDDASAENGSITFHDTLGASVTIDFVTMLAGYEIGNNTANRIAPFFAAALGLGPIDEVVLTLGGSGAIDNLTFVPVPEPATALCLGVGLALLGVRARRRSS